MGLPQRHFRRHPPDQPGMTMQPLGTQAPWWIHGSRCPLHEAPCSSIRPITRTRAAIIPGLTMATWPPTLGRARYVPPLVSCRGRGEPVSGFLGHWAVRPAQLTSYWRAEPQCPAGRLRGMRPHVRCAPGTALLLAACVAMAAGCAAARTTTGPAASPGSRERAVTDAAAILKAFVVPPGARRLPQAPDALKVPITTVVSTTLVDVVSFWRAPGQPQAVLAWEQAHLPGSRPETPISDRRPGTARSR